MAYHSSSILSPTTELIPSFSDRSEVKNRTLPPRKRLLASLKNVPSTDKLSDSPSRLTTDDDVDAVVVIVDDDNDDPPQAFQVAEKEPSKSCFDINNKKMVLSQSLPQSLSIEKCTVCGDSDVLVHRISDVCKDSNSGSSFYCSSCVLSTYKQMYCFLCLKIIKQGLPSLLACCICQQLSHCDCARRLCPSSLEGSDPFLCDQCRGKDEHDNNIRRSHTPEPYSKKRKKASIDSVLQDPPSGSDCRKNAVVDQKTLAAARVVAAIAEKEAYRAKEKATEIARLAASATLRAQIALDTAYDLSHSKLNSNKQNDDTVIHHDEEEKDAGNSTIKSPRGSKKRALSAIVASEKMYSKHVENVKTSAATEKPVKKRKHKMSGGVAYISDDDNGCISGMRCMKRKKSLSTIGTEMSSVFKYKGSKLPASKCKSTKMSCKGKLGAIFSRALALGKGEKKSSETSPNQSTDHSHALPATDVPPHIVLEPTVYHKNAIHSASISKSSNSNMPKTFIANASHSFQHDFLATNYDSPAKGHRRSSFSVLEDSKTNLGDREKSGMKKGNINGAIVSEQERRLFEFLNKTLVSNKVMFTKVPTAGSIMQKR